MNNGLKASDHNGGYIPTAEEKLKVKRVPGKFKLSGDAIFHTLQGEGQFAGMPTTFVRLHMCNLKCSWCDARYTWKSDEAEFYREPFDLTPEELYDGIIQAQKSSGLSDETLCRDITITGGEPLLQSRTLVEFLNKYQQEFDRIQIETNGTIPLLPEIAGNEKIYFNCSPKIESSGNDLKTRFRENALKQIQGTGRAIFKFVFSTKEDIDEVAELYPFLDRKNIWLMPEGVLVEEHREVFDRCIDHIVSSGYNVAVRTQSIMWDGAKRGV